MKVLVTGATGFIGKRLCVALAERGHTIHVLTRDASTATKRIATPVTAFSWNAETNTPPEESFNGVEAVIHLAGEGVAEKRWTDAQKKKIYDSRILGTRNLVKGIAKYGKSVKTLVSSSAIGYYGDRGDETLTENSKPADRFLAKVCIEWEKEAAAAPNSVRTVLLRTGIVLGEDGGALKKLLPIFRLGAGGPVGTGKQWMSWIHVDDMVGLYLHALEKPTLQGPVNAVGPNPVRNNDFSKALGKALRRPAIVPAPAFALKLALGEMAEIVLASQRVLPEAAKSSNYDFQYSTIESAFDEIVKKKALKS